MIIIQNGHLVMEDVLRLADKYSLAIYNTSRWLEGMHQLPAGTVARMVILASIPDVWGKLAEHPLGRAYDTVR